MSYFKDQVDCVGNMLPLSYNAKNNITLHTPLLYLNIGPAHQYSFHFYLEKSELWLPLSCGKNCSNKAKVKMVIHPELQPSSK